MKVHLIKHQTIEQYAAKNAGSRAAFDHWLTSIKNADWFEPKDILGTFPNADNLGNGTDRVIFNIGGNNFRLIGKYAFGLKNVHLFICWIGTHAEYSELCRQRKQYDINIY